MHESLLSGAPTPSGVETPRPDFQDKRLPGILNSYFGQVGNQASSASKPSPQDAQAVTAHAHDSAMARYSSKHNRSRRGSTGSLDSLVKVDRTQIDTPPASDDYNFETPERSDKGNNSTQPATPISADPEEVQQEEQSAENGGPLAKGGLASITHALKSFVQPKSTFASQARRHQSLPTSKLNRKSVAAAHISNPTSSSQSPSSTSPSSPPPSETMHSSVSIQELNKLTLDAAPESREKNTPPLTPRTLSTNDRLSGAKSPRSIASATSDDGAGSQTTTSARRDETLPTGTPRGKLKVRIAEGRGLKPSVEPYCVCVFEWNEYISEGPKQDRMDIDSDQKKTSPAPRLSSIPIKRTDSDMGKPMAIPMRSRQSSTNGMDENRLEKVTDPHWEHDATL